MLALHLFGQPRIFIDSQAYRFTAPPKTLPLLSYLLLHRNQVVERQQVAFTLWPDDPESDARTNLRRHLHWLGKALPPCSPERPWLLLTHSTLRWNPQSDYWLDVAEFERLVENPESLAEAVTLYTGDLLETVYDDWLFFERERLQQSYFAALEKLIQQRRAQCRYAEAIQYCQLLLTRDPLREDALRRLLTLHYQAGDRAGVMAEYERFAARLKKEMGIEPMPETRAVYEIALRQRQLPDEESQPAQGEQSKQPSSRQPGLPFVGRKSEMERFGQRWSRVAQGGGGLLLLSGEAGVGKTRLIGEMAALVESQGGRVLLGGMSPEENAPYQALVEAFRGALPLLASLDREETRLAALTLLLPELRQRRRLPVLPALLPERERMRLFDAMAGCLERLAAPRPLLLVLEDLHWAGESTLNLIEYLARRLAKQRILILGTYREEEVDRQHPLRQLRHRLQDEKLVEYQALQRLDAGALTDLLEQAGWPVLMDEARTSAAQRLYAASQGNPLFVSLLIQQLREDAQPKIDFLTEIKFLNGIHPVIQQRMQHLTPLAKTYAEVAAVIGLAFDAEVVRETGGWSEGEGLNALDELLDRQLAREGGPACDYSFAHHLVQACLYAAIPPERLRRRHRRAAGVLEELYPERRDELSGTLALHYDRGGEPRQAIPYYHRAAQNYLAVFADREALQALSRAVEVVREDDSAPVEHFELLKLRQAIYDRLGKRDEQRADQQIMETIAQALNDRRRLCEALRARILLLRALGERQAEREAVDTLKSEAQKLGDPYWRAVGLHMEGHLTDLLGDAPAAVELLQQAILFYQAAKDDLGELECLTKLAEADIKLRNAIRAETWIQRALKLSQGVNQAQQVMFVLWLMAANGLVVLDIERCLSYGQQCLEYAQRVNDLFWRATTHRLLAQAYNRKFDIAKTRHHLDQAERLFNIQQRPSGLAMVYETTASLELELGNYEAGRSLYQQALEMFERLGNLNNQTIEWINLSNVAELQQDYASQKACALRALSLTRQIENRFLESFALSSLGAVERKLGNLPAALEYLLAAREICDSSNTLVENIGLLGDLALSYLASGDLLSASRTADEMESIYPQAEAGASDSQRILWGIAQVRRAAGQHEIAADFLKQAYQQVEEKSVAILDSTSRHAFRDLIFNRQIITAYERGVWPEPQKVGELSKAPAGYEHPGLTDNAE
jgi:DNA-binding SARP family transcriptional activator/tetratricopeptide (TPR) repeat protein